MGFALKRGDRAVRSIASAGLKTSFRVGTATAWQFLDAVVVQKVQPIFGIGHASLFIRHGGFWAPFAFS